MGATAVTAAPVNGRLMLVSLAAAHGCKLQQVSMEKLDQTRWAKLSELSVGDLQRLQEPVMRALAEAHAQLVRSPVDAVTFADAGSRTLDTATAR